MEMLHKQMIQISVARLTETHVRVSALLASQTLVITCLKVGGQVLNMVPTPLVIPKGGFLDIQFATATIE